MGRKVLIIDNQPGTVACIEYLLKQAGYEVATASNGEEALKSITADKPDLILMDTMLPQRNGYEVCQTIRENPRWQDIRIVFLSARTSDAEKAKGMDLGADDYVCKPFCNTELVEKVNALLESVEWT